MLLWTSNRKETFTDLRRPYNILTMILEFDKTESKKSNLPFDLM